MIRPLFASLLVLALCGCQSFHLETPADFVQLEEPGWSDYALRATSADGVVLAVRNVPNAGEGSLAFWTQALGDRLSEGRGYALQGEESVTAATGEVGTQLHFGQDVGETPYTYWVSIFVTAPGALSASRVLVVEAGGERGAFDAARGRLTAAIASLEID